MLLQIFGSFATGLHLPTSDVDCVITDSTVAPHQAGNALTALGTALRGKEWVKDLEVCTFTSTQLGPLSAQIHVRYSAPNQPIHAQSARFQ